MANLNYPSPHAASHEPGGLDPLAVDEPAGTGSLRTLGAGAQQAVSGTDARLSDARTPTAHHGSHEPGGSDPLAVDQAAGVASLRTLGAGATQAVSGTDARLSDARTPTAHAASHGPGGADELLQYGYGWIPLLSARLEAYGRIGITSNFTRTLGTVFLVFFTPPAGAPPFSKIGFISAAANATATLARMGVYFVDNPGTGHLTLLARTANDPSIATSGAADVNRSFDTTGGFPATVTPDPAVRLALAYIEVGGAAGSLVGKNIGTGPMSNAGGVRICGTLAAQADLPLSINGGSLAGPGSAHWSYLAA